MNADAYKQAKQQALSYELLLFTKRQLEAANKTLLAERIENIILHNKLPLPEMHKAQHELYAGFYKIDLSFTEIEEIISVLGDKEAEVSQTAVSPAFYASAVDTWQDLLS